GPTGRVANASVCATRTGGATACGTTGGDGRAVIELPRGTYSIRATPPKGARLADGVAVVDLDESTSAVVTLEGRATIAGTVKDEAGHGLVGAQVCAQALETDDVPCAETRDGGAYTVAVKPGFHKLEITGPPNGSRFIAQWARGRASSDEADVIDTRTADAGGVDVVLRPGVVLSGTVLSGLDGTPQKEAQVCTYAFTTPLGWDCDRTDKNGRYALVREPDTYWVWAIPPGDRGSRLIYELYSGALQGVDATPFDLHRDRALDIALPAGPVLRGRVTTTDGAPVALAFVCVDTPFPTGKICRTTADDGSYEVATRSETYVVNVVPPADSDVIAGYWPNAVPDWTKAQSIRVGPGDARLDITLPRGVRVSGTIRDASGAPVEAATVNVNDASGPRYFGATDIHGHYSIAVPPGEYAVDVFPPRIDAVSVVGQRLSVSGDVGYDVVLPRTGLP
ncbi:MAG: carboxypeptidase regulatory-like domain-containing protein, partial [Chloroflexota bacterium]|nr:carboxypeptidase regulatory-like domain-containing protein [Chloroflexota bacterium]